jgi:hypothetical protein
MPNDLRQVRNNGFALYSLNYYSLDTSEFTLLRNSASTYPVSGRVAHNCW